MNLNIKTTMAAVLSFLFLISSRLQLRSSVWTFPAIHVCRSQSYPCQRGFVNAQRIRATKKLDDRYPGKQIYWYRLEFFYFFPRLKRVHQR